MKHGPKLVNLAASHVLNGSLSSLFCVCNPQNLDFYEYKTVRYPTFYAWWITYTGAQRRSVILKHENGQIDAVWAVLCHNVTV